MQDLENKATHCRKDDAFGVKSDDVQANGNGKRTLGDHKTAVALLATSQS